MPSASAPDAPRIDASTSSACSAASFTLDPTIEWNFKHGRSMTAAVGACIPTLERFRDEKAEAEYQRFAHQHDYMGAALWDAAISLAEAATVLNAASADLLSMQRTAVFTVGAGVLFVAAAAEFAMCVWPQRRSRDIAVDAQHIVVWRHKVIIVATWSLRVALRGAVAMVGPYCDGSSPRFAASATACSRALRGSIMADFLGSAALIRSPLLSWPLLVAFVVAQTLGFLDLTTSTTDVALRIALSALLAVVLGWGVLARDAATRQYFRAIVTVEATSNELLAQRHELLAVVTQAVPAPLLSRLVNRGASTVVPQLRDSASDALVCMTSPSNFDRLTTVQSLRVTLTELHRLFTLLDAGSGRFAMDRTAVFGDTYVVTSGLLRPADATMMVKYAEWQLRELAPQLGSSKSQQSGLHQRGDEEGAAAAVPARYALRCAITRGEVHGTLSTRGTVTYLVRGGAIDQARRVVRQVPGGSCWVDASVMVMASVVPSPASGRPDDDDAASPRGTAHMGGAEGWARPIEGFAVLVVGGGSENPGSSESSTALRNQSGVRTVAQFLWPQRPVDDTRTVELEGSCGGVTRIAAPSVVPAVEHRDSTNPLAGAVMMNGASSPRPAGTELPERSGTAGREAVVAPGAVEIRVPLTPPHWLRGVFDDPADESDYGRDAAAVVRGGAPQMFSLMFVLSFGTVVIAGGERVWDRSESFGTPASVDAAFFALHGAVVVVSGMLGPLPALLLWRDAADAPSRSASQSDCERRGIARPADADEPAIEDAFGAAGEREDLLDTLASLPCVGVVLQSEPRIVAVWVVLVATAMASLFALQRSVVTNGAFFTSVFGLGTVVMLRSWRWYNALAVALLVCIVPLTAVTYYHVGLSTGNIAICVGAGVACFLASRAGPQTAREQFALQQRAVIALDLIAANATLLKRVVQRQMPATVADQGLNALRVSLAKTRDSASAGTLQVLDFFSDFLCVHVRRFDAGSGRDRGSCGGGGDTAPHWVEQDALREVLREAGGGELGLLQALGDEMVIGGPFRSGDEAQQLCVTAALRVLSVLVYLVPGGRFGASAALEEAAGAIVGALSVRYRVFGVAASHAAAILDAASAAMTLREEASRVGGSRSGGGCTLYVTRRVHRAMSAILSPRAEEASGRAARASVDDDGVGGGGGGCAVVEPQYGGSAQWRLRSVGSVPVHVYTLGIDGR